MTPRQARAAGSAISVALLALLPALAHAPAAQAAAYRYWTYWQAPAGSWQFAAAGPAFTLPADGSVEGWRFAVSSAQGSMTAEPQVPPSFADICGGTPAREGAKRVALVIDPGDAGQAPAGELPGSLTTACVVAEPDATGYAVLRSTAQVRTQDGLVCAIAGYPAHECAPIVDESTVTAGAQATPSAQSTPSAQAAPAPAPAPTGPSPWLTVAVALIAVGAGLLIWRRRRRG